MVSNQPDRIPPAFRGRTPGAASFLGLNDDQVLKIAAVAYRQHDWAGFDDAMTELAGRAQRHILAKLREHGALADGQVIPGGHDGELQPAPTPTSLTACKAEARLCRHLHNRASAPQGEAAAWQLITPMTVLPVRWWHARRTCVPLGNGVR